MHKIVVEWMDEDKSRARFSLPGRNEWRAEHVSALIQLLSEIRAEMTPPVPVKPPALEQIEPIHNPVYATQLHQFSGGSILEFRHPSLGWMEFVLPSVERSRISRFLEEQETLWQGYRR